MITFTLIARTLLSLALSVLPLATSAQQSVCSPPTEPLPVLKLQRAGVLHTVDGAMVPFDYCHKSVSFEVPSLAEKPPLMILVHVWLKPLTKQSPRSSVLSVDLRKTPTIYWTQPNHFAAYQMA